MISVSKEDAKKQGLVRYFTGKPCKHGHIAERKVSNSGCITCHDERSNLFRQQNADQERRRLRNYKLKNEEKVKEAGLRYRTENKQKERLRHEKYEKENREKVLAAKKAHFKEAYRKDPEKVKAATRKWQKANPEKRRETARKYQKKQWKNPTTKLRILLRNRLNCSLKHGGKSGSAVKDLGCTVAELKLYLEHQFDANMCWSNHGTYWHIDHIHPLSSFDLTDRTQLLQACHYTNLQPLEKIANIKKSNKRAIS